MKCHCALVLCLVYSTTTVAASQVNYRTNQDDAAAAAAGAPPQQRVPLQDLSFDITQGANLLDGQTTVKQLVFSSKQSDSPSTASSASDLYHLAVSLLDSLTAHATPSTGSTVTTALRSSHRPSVSWLDSLQTKLGPTTGTLLSTSRSALSYLYAGSDSKRRSTGTAASARDWSVRGAVTSLKKLATSYATLSTHALPGRKRGPQGWQAKLEAASGLRAADVVLDESEVQEAMHQVITLASQAAQAGSPEAWLLLGDLHLSGHLTLQPNTTTAAEAYKAASEGWGSPEAQYKLGFLHGTNYGEAFGGSEGEGHQGSALLHYTFAALSRHPAASMTVGYRHWVGLGVKKSCKDALNWYKAAADQAMIAFNAGPPGGRHLPPPKLRLSDLQGGVYGPGASASSLLHSGGGTPQREWNDLLEYYHFHADQGDLRDMYKLGRLYYQGFGGDGLGGARGGRGRLNVGQPGLRDRLHDGGRDFANASKWFMALATKVWRKDPPREVVTNPQFGKRAKSEAPRLFYDGSKDIKLTKEEPRIVIGALAAGHLGKMYLRGEGTTANYAKAFLWFQRGAAHGDRESNNGLGIMYRDGLGVPRDLQKANLYFHSAAQQDLAEAQVNLGKYHFGMGEYATATTYFEHALRIDGQRQPDTFQSYYYLAELNARAINHEEQCPLAVSFYKLIAERGDWEHEVWWEAQRAYASGDERKAFLGFWLMAERGYEPAQNNIAFMLDRDKQRLRLPLVDPEPASNATDRLALTYWTRSAAQDNVDALVKTGDYYFAGTGTDQPQYQKAAACYQSATMTRTSAMALWNLGWMHEHGKGVAQDYHLAKRFYDQAIETSPDAYLPSMLALVGLYARALRDILFRPSSDDNLKALSLFGDVVSFQTKDMDHDLGATPSWTASRVWRELQRRWGYDVPEDQEDAVRADAAAQAAQQAGDRRQAPRARNGLDQRGLEGVDDSFDWQAEDGGPARARRRTARVGEEDDDDEYDFLLDGEGDFGGTVAIVALCVILAWLLYVRQGHMPQQQPVHAQAAGAAAGAGRQPEHEERLV